MKECKTTVVFHRCSLWEEAVPFQWPKVNAPCLFTSQSLSRRACSSWAGGCASLAWSHESYIEATCSLGDESGTRSEKGQDHFTADGGLKAFGIELCCTALKIHTHTHMCMYNLCVYISLFIAISIYSNWSSQYPGAENTQCKTLWDALLRVSRTSPAKSMHPAQLAC